MGALNLEVVSGILKEVLEFTDPSSWQHSDLSRECFLKRKSAGLQMQLIDTVCHRFSVMEDGAVEDGKLHVTARIMYDMADRAIVIIYSYLLAKVFGEEEGVCKVAPTSRGRRALRQAQDIRSEILKIQPMPHLPNRTSDSSITFDF
jgi:hypothetical protein